MKEEDIEYTMNRFNKTREDAIDMLNKGFNVDFIRGGMRKETLDELKTLESEVKQKVEDIIKEEFS